MIVKVTITFLMTLCLSTMLISVRGQGMDIPADVKPFVGKDKIALALETADLNGDGTKDHILVLERVGADKNDGTEDKRWLLVLIRDTKGNLKLAKTNDKVVYCRSCGGVFGDPFAGIRVRAGSFTVDNYGGSNWRWSDSYTFNYSRIDKTWQLLKVVKVTFNATDSNQVKSKTVTPKKFGKVDIASADPEKIH